MQLLGTNQIIDTTGPLLLVMLLDRLNVVFAWRLLHSYVM